MSNLGKLIGVCILTGFQCGMCFMAIAAAIFVERNWFAVGFFAFVGCSSAILGYLDISAKLNKQSAPS